MPERKILETGPSPRGWHRLQYAIECPQKYAYRYELGIETFNSSTSPALVKGSMMHLILAQHYNRVKNVAQGLDPDEWEEPIKTLQIKADSESPVWADNLDNIIKCFQAYLAHYPVDPFEVLEVERLAYAQIGDHLFTGRFDLVVKDRGGKVWIIDHKTTARLLARQKKFYGISGQMIGYSYIGHSIYGEKFGGMLLNQIQHTGKYKFDRIRLPPAPNLLRRFPQVVDDTEKLITRLKEEKRPPDQWPLAMNELTCYTRYGACPYMDHCQWGISNTEEVNS